MSKRINHTLKNCPVCDAVMPKSDSESWPTYGKKTACSPSHAAIFRQQRLRSNEDAVKSLIAAIGRWSSTNAINA